MGNTSSGKGNGIYVQLDTPTVQPGDPVSGVVHLQIASAVQMTGIELKVTGLERTYWREVRREDRSRSRGDGTEERYTEEIPVSRYEKREFFKVRIPVYSLNQTIAQGQYSFPFRFVMPQGLPGTFVVEGSRGFGHHERCGDQAYDAACLYKIKATCGEVGRLGTWPLKHTVMLNLVERPPPIMQVVSEATAHVRICCCFNRGTVHIKMRAEKNSYAPGEVIRVLADFENRSKSVVRHVDLTVNRSLILRAHGHRKSEPKRVAYVAHAIELQPGERRDGSDQPLMLQLPQGLPPMCNGNLIQCSYTLTVSTSVRCAPAPSATVPICMYMPQPPPAFNMAAPSAPPGWAPQSFATTEFQIPAPSAPPPLAPAYQGGQGQQLPAPAQAQAPVGGAFGPTAQQAMAQAPAGGPFGGVPAQNPQAAREPLLGR